VPSLVKIDLAGIAALDQCRRVDDRPESPQYDREIEQEIELLDVLHVKLDSLRPPKAVRTCDLREA
jgi:hypothetical protein